MVLGFVEGDVGKGVKASGRSRGDGGTGDDVRGAVRDIEEGEVFDVIKGSPDKSRRWGILELRRLRSGGDGLKDAGGDIKRTWVVPSIVRALEDLKDGGGGVRNVLLIDVLKGRPGGDRDMGKGRGGDGSGLRSVERHLILN